ncbi:MAG: ABC transporter permease [bacterium]
MAEIERTDRELLEEEVIEAVEEVEWASLSQWQLMWRRFKRSKIAIVGGVIIVLFYVVCVLFAEFFAPYDKMTIFDQYVYANPQRIHFIEDGRPQRPFVYGMDRKLDPKTFRWVFTPNKNKKYPVRFFARGDQYKFWGFFKGDIHFIAVDEGGTLFLLGTDSLGRDLLSQIIYGGRVSLTVGFLGVLMSLVIGSVLGTISGYYGGVIDLFIQRAIEFMMAFPAIPLWMAFSAALPAEMDLIKRFFMISVILSLVGWGGLARQVRAKTLSFREMDFTMAARASGVSDMGIILKHLLPSSASHIIVVATLAIPGMILGETALSFLGLGIRPPMTSWGVLLQEAQKVVVLRFYPWIILPAFFVVIAILSFNFLGDGLRDAADPYGRA